MKRIYWLFIALVVGVVMLTGVASPPNRISHAQTGELLEYGASVRGSISPEAPLAMYNFNGNIGDLVHVDVRGLTNGFDPTVDLIGPDQQPLASSQYNRLAVNSRNVNIGLFLPQSGTYTLMVGGMNGTTGDFVLRLQGRAPVVSTPLTYGQAVQVTVPQNAPPQFYTFDAQDCPTILSVINLSGGQPFTFPYVVKVRNQQGQDVALLRGGDAQGDRVTVAPLSGHYEVEVLSDDPALEGAITLLVSCAEAQPGCQPAGGEGEASAGGEGVAVAEGPSCVGCPTCPEDLLNEPVCPDMDVRILVGDRFLPIWNTVPGADHYWVHLYGLHGDEQVHISADGAAGDATSLDAPYRNLPEGFDGYRFVVEAMQGDEVICVGEASIRIAEFECPDLNVTTIADAATRTITWSWDNPDGFGRQLFVFPFAVMPDGSREEVAIMGHGVALDSQEFTVTVPFDEYPTHTFGLILRPNLTERFCEAEAIVEFPGPMAPQIPLETGCESFTATAELVDREAAAVTLSWSTVPGAVLYRHNLFAVMEDGSEQLTLLTTGYGPDITSLAWTLPLDMVSTNVWRFEITAETEDGTIICTTEAIVRLDDLQGTEALCENFSAWISEDTGAAVTFAWSDYPGAERYVVYVTTQDGELVAPFPIYAESPWSTASADVFVPGSYTFGVGAWFEETGAICHKQIPFVLAGGQVTPCLIRTDRQNVPVHVGPGQNRSVFTFLPPNQDFTVIGQAPDSEGNPWWEIDKTQIPGHEGVNGLWVAQADVTATGGCDQVQNSEAPPIIPDTQPQPSGGWQGCGSCTTCGHPSECVTSPEGECLWDPGTCAAPPPSGPGEAPPGESPPAQACYQLGTAIDGFHMGSLSVLTPTNCTVAMLSPKDSMVGQVEKQQSLLMCSAVSPAAPSESTLALQSQGYLPGTVVTIQYNPPTYPSCYVKRWVGCGAGGGGNTTSFTMTGSCTITAYVHCS